MIRSKVDEVIKKSTNDLQKSRSPVRPGRSPVGRQSNYNTITYNDNMQASGMKRTYLGDSMNARGSPLRRQHFEY
jgi:hypothetical protein